MTEADYLFKVLIIGDIGTGKTSIIKRYVQNVFSLHYRSTIGVDFALKVLEWPFNEVEAADYFTVNHQLEKVDIAPCSIRLQLWDIAGQERFGSMTRVYYKDAIAAIIVFDVNRTATFDAVLKWKKDIRDKVTLSDGSEIPIIIMANKLDSINQTQKDALKGKLDNLIMEHGFSAWFGTSAKNNINIEKACHYLVTKILSIPLITEAKKKKKDDKEVKLNNNNNNGFKINCC